MTEPLTINQIEELAKDEQLLLFCDTLEDLVDIVRAVEQKQKEVNHE